MASTRDGDGGDDDYENVKARIPQGHQDLFEKLFQDGALDDDAMDILRVLPEGLLGKQLAVAKELQGAKKELGDAKKELGDAKKELGSLGQQAERVVRAVYFTDPSRTTRRIPPVAISSKIEPSVHGGEGKKRADISIDEASWTNITRITVPVALADDRQTLVGSSLGQIPTNNEGSFEYVNEASIQKLCDAMIIDAARCAGCSEKDFAVHCEFTLYTMRPDIILILRVKGRIVFCVEVKSPEREGREGEVFLSPFVGGQIWSYLVLMKQLGHPCPTGAVMTYNKMVLVSLSDLSQDTDHAVGRGEAESVMTDKSDIIVPIIVEEELESESDCRSRENSPDPVRAKMTDKIPRVSEEIKPGALLPKVFYSQVFADGDVFPALTCAIRMAYRRTIKEEGIKTELCFVDHGDDIRRRLYYFVNEDSFNWCVPPDNFPLANAKEMPYPNSGWFYFLSTLDSGSSGAVYLACNTSAKLCCVKVYHIERSTALLNSERQKDFQNGCKEQAEIAKKEELMWGEMNKLYEPPRKYVAFIKTLDGRPCLVMPYGRPIPNEFREQALGPVEQLLNRAAKMGYAYKQSDVRWRHVLFDHDENVFLADLESMEPLEREETRPIEQIVADQMKILRRGIIKSDSADTPSTPPSKKQKRH